MSDIKTRVVKLLEDMRKVGGRNSPAIVGDGQAYSGVFHQGGDADQTITRPAVFDGVVDQIDKEAQQFVVIGAEQDRRHIDLYRNGLCL